jgi:hypothetical protein
MRSTEEDIREALVTRAGTPVVGAMPAGARRRVRIRQTGVAAVLTSFVAGVLAVAFIAYGSVGRSNPVPGRTVDPAADGYASPLEDVPPHWPAVNIADPSTAYVPRLNDPSVVAGPVVLASGSVDGSSFTLYGYTQRQGHSTTACLGFVGFAAPGSPTSTAPDMVTCADAPPVPRAGDVAFIGGGSADRRDLEANFGFVSRRVDVVAVWGGRSLGMFEIPPLERLHGWDVTPFFFVPSADAGPLEVDARVNGDTLELAHADICPPSNVSGTCRAQVHQDLPLSSLVDVPVPLAPGEWPVVTYGGDFEPYVDHEATAGGLVDPGVVGEKTVIAYGTVQGAPWSLVVYNARYPGAPGDVAPESQLFITGVGGSGGGLYQTQPWTPNDLGGGRMHGDDAGFDSIDGVVSSRVATVRLELSDGTVRQADLISGPDGVDARFFLMFVPAGSDGRVVALDGSGREIEQMCLRDMMGVPPGGDPCST